MRSRSIAKMGFQSGSSLCVEKVIAEGRYDRGRKARRGRWSRRREVRVDPGRLVEVSKGVRRMEVRRADRNIIGSTRGYSLSINIYIYVYIYIQAL